MPSYQKAYNLNQLRQFADWPADDTEVPKARQDVTDAQAAGQDQPSDPQQDDGDELLTEQIVYLREDLTVASSCFDDSKIIFDAATPEWESFCRDVLKFEVPDWEEESRQVREKLAAMNNEPKGGEQN